MKPNQETNIPVSFIQFFWSPKQIILNVIFILNNDYTWHYKPENSILVRTCSI